MKIFILQSGWEGAMVYGRGKDLEDRAGRLLCNEKQ